MKSKLHEFNGNVKFKIMLTYRSKLRLNINKRFVEQLYGKKENCIFLTNEILTKCVSEKYIDGLKEKIYEI